MKNNRTYLFVTLIVTILSELYFYPFSSPLRFAVGVAALSFFLLTLDELSIPRITAYCGISVLCFRTLFGLFAHDLTLGMATRLNFPAMVYYFIYGFLAYFADLQRDKNNMVRTIFILTFIDSFSNIMEAVIRNNLTLGIVKAIIVVGFARSFCAYFVYWFYKKQELYIQTTEHQKRYTQLNKIISDIQAEMFYLKKSMSDIEDVMSKSYSLYETYKSDDKLRDITLTISRDVHEIKKDYYRVIKGFESFLKKFEKDDSMRISDIFTIIEDNTLRYIDENSLGIKITFFMEHDFYLKTYYSLFSILNNLIINSIHACEENDYINVYQYCEGEYVVFKVCDTGEGIDEDLLPYILNPGFTTKYDNLTGKPSTGIGLSHIVNILDELDGNINIESVLNEGTTVIIKIPKISVIGDNNDE